MYGSFSPTIPTKQQKPFKGNNPATVAKTGGPNSVPIDPQAVPASTYTKTQKQFKGGNQATVTKNFGGMIIVEPESTLPKAYTKKQPR
jgi:hypothetical protein